ncbi:MAG: murein biosynthesis integral membrane protein MurJ [Acidimicrobiia bacterium]
MTWFMNRLKRGDVGAAAIIVAAGILVSRFLGIIRDMVFAALLGSSGTTDEYVAAFRIPDYANYLLAGGFLTITFIPIFAKYLADKDEEGGWRAFTAILRWLALGITAVIVLAWMATPWIIEALYPDFNADQLASTITLTRIILPAQFAFVVGALFVAVQYAQGVFTIPTLAPVIYNLAIIIGGVGWTIFAGEADPAGFIWGALIGAFVGNFALQIWGAKRVGMRLVRGTSWTHPAVKAYLLIAIPLMIGQSIVALDEVFMSVFGNMVEAGAQTDLQYARRTMFVPIGVIAQAAAVAAYPTLARLFAEGRRDAMLATVNKALAYVLVLSIGAAGIVVALAYPLVRVLYERGEFTSEVTESVSAALFVYAFAIPVWGALQIITRAFYATKDMWTPVIVGSAITIVAIPGYFVAQEALGIQGVALASVLSLSLYTGVLAAIWYRRPDATEGGRTVVASAGRAIPLAVPASFAAALASWAIWSGITGAPTIAAIVALIVGAAVYAGVALGLGGLLYDWLSKDEPSPASQQPSGS